MSIKLTLFIILLSHYSHAQIKGIRSATRFDKFIKGQKIQWAAYTGNVIISDKYNLTDELYKRFHKDEIKISLPINRDSLMAYDKISYLNKLGLQQRSYAPGSDYSKPTNRLDSQSLSTINVEEILYVADGKLYSYIPWISPRISIYTSRDIFLGTSEYFSSCINSKYNFKSSKRDKLIYLASTDRRILIDSFQRTDLLKQFYGINILEAIWKEVMNDKNEITDLRNGEKTLAKNIQVYSFPNLLTIPVYDSLGNIIASTVYNEAISPSLFQQMEISQNWYYNYTKNILTNTITDITLFVGKSFYNSGELNPFIKITFK
jgi:hypothetical protein